MKYLSAILIGLLFVTAGCQQAPGPASTEPEVIQGTQNVSKAIVLYYSRTGDTRVVARTIQEALDCDLQEVKDLKDRSGIKGFWDGTKDVSNKVKADIKPETRDLEAYDLIVICSPVWVQHFAPAVTTFMDTIDFKDKKVMLAAVARMGMSDEKREELKREIQAKGADVIQDFVIKTWFQSPEDIKELTKEQINFHNK